LRGALATKQSSLCLVLWIASLAMTETLLSQNEQPGSHREINITIRLQWNPKAAKDAAAKLCR
jgi:hypothetical protein